MGNTLNKDFWDERWQSGQTGWDMGKVSPPLKAYIDQLTDKTMSLLIPGCGNTYEAEYLLQQGFTNITVVDISPTLTKKLREKFAAWLGKDIQVVCSDFFDFDGQFDLIFEQTFFCALDKSLRLKYVDRIVHLLKRNGRLVGLLFDKDFGFDHPPYGGSAEEYKMLFETKFNFHALAPCYNSHPARSGSELFINLVKK